MIEAIYTTAKKGTPLASVAEATLVPGKGLLGDRYAEGVGTFSKNLQGKPDTEVTLIESEEILRFNALEGAAKSPGEFRRNVVTHGIRLNELVGKRFAVGDALLEGIRLCEPCSYLAKRVRPTVIETMAHRAGLRARVVTGAVVRPGDPVRPCDP